MNLCVVTSICVQFISLLNLQYNINFILKLHGILHLQYEMLPWILEIYNCGFEVCIKQSMVKTLQ